MFNSNVLRSIHFGLTLLLAASFEPRSSFAGSGQEGRGGDVVACFSSDAVTERVEAILRANASGVIQKDPLEGVNLEEVMVQEYDLYLARLPRVGVSPLIKDRTNLEALLVEIDTLSGRANADFARDLKVAQKSLAWQRNRWVEAGSGVIAINDSDDAVLLPKNCLLLQIAHQAIVGSLATIYYDPRLFGRMSVVDQAGLIYHEWVYNRHVANANAKSSGATQQIVGLMFREDFGLRQSEAFAMLLRNVGFFGTPGQIAGPRCEWRNVEIQNFRVVKHVIAVDETRFETEHEGKRVWFTIRAASRGAGNTFANPAMIDRLREAYSDRRLVRLTFRPSLCNQSGVLVNPGAALDAIERVQFEE